jgi:hypothetical protein
MALVVFPVTPIIMDLPDYDDHGIIVKRRAEIIEFYWAMKERYVRVIYDVLPYSSDEGDYGVRLDQQPDTMFVVQRTTILANNSKLVDFRNGDFICMTSEEYLTAEDGSSYLNPLLEGLTYIKDYDRYYRIATTQSVIMVDTIKAAILDQY